MPKTNVQIVEEFIEQVFNQKKLERLSDFCSKDCVSHAAPYVGLGGNFESTPDKRLVLVQIEPRGPMDGHLQIGDELVRVKREDQTWETFDELRDGFWARGLADMEIVATVHRHGNMVTVPISLGQIDGLESRVLDWFKTVIPYLQQNWPDFNMEIREIFGAGDMVACYMVNRGTNSKYGRSATWAEMDMYRLRDGKITDIWYVENVFDQLEQLGYQITEPVRELA